MKNIDQRGEAQMRAQLENVFKKYHEKLSTYAESLIKKHKLHDKEVNDLLDEAYTNMLNYLEGMGSKVDSALAANFRKAIHDAAISTKRKTAYREKAERGSIPRDEQEPVDVDKLLDLEKMLDVNNKDSAVYRFREPEKVADIMTLMLQGLSSRDIAEQLGLSKDNVQKIQVRFRDRAKEIVEKEYEPSIADDEREDNESLAEAKKRLHKIKKRELRNSQEKQAMLDKIIAYELVGGNSIEQVAKNRGVDEKRCRQIRNSIMALIKENL